MATTTTTKQTARARVTVAENRSAYTPCLDVCVDGRRLIDVSKDSDFGSREAWRGSEINWSAIGCVSVEYAEAFAEAILRAIREAKRLDRKYPAGESVRPYLDAKEAEHKRLLAKKAKNNQELAKSGE